MSGFDSASCKSHINVVQAFHLFKLPHLPSSSQGIINEMNPRVCNAMGEYSANVRQKVQR